MHRVSVSLVLLIAAAACSTTMPAGAPLETVNPWLSACDLAQPATAPDLQGTCTSASLMPIDWLLDEGPGPPPPPPCVGPPPLSTSSSSSSTSSSSSSMAPNVISSSTSKPFNNNNNNNNNNKNNNTSAPRNASTTSNQCLYYLEESHKQTVCDAATASATQRLQRLAPLRLRHCREHHVPTALGPALLDQVLAGGPRCQHTLAALLDTDALAARITCEFTEVLIRYDCGQPYSIVYHCDDCKEAYRRWVCSSLVPHFTTIPGASGGRTSSGGGSGGGGGSAVRRRVRPCRSVCQTVEQRCPYMLPGDRAPAHPTQYAGEPTFLCLDPNIPETGEQAVKSSHGAEDCCYTYCELGVCARCAGAAGRPDVATVNDTAWRVRCPSVAVAPAAAAAADARASNCAAAQPPAPPPAAAAPEPLPSTAFTNHAHAHHRTQTVQITIFAVAWTAVWTKPQLITITILMNNFVINKLHGLLLMFVNSAHNVFLRQLHGYYVTVISDVAKSEHANSSTTKCS